MFEKTTSSRLDTFQMPDTYHCPPFQTAPQIFLQVSRFGLFAKVAFVP
jgi:hypothetical protein